jgi:acyl carrier protein
MVEPSQPTGDAPCPACGHLLWFVEAVSGLRLFEKRVSESLADILERMGVARDEFEEALISDNEIAKELRADSLDLVQLILELEERFGINFSEQELSKIHTLADLIEYIQVRRKRPE